MMRREEPSHGMFVGFPTYTVKDTAGDAHHLEVTIPEGERFGFWPGSDSTYIVSGRWEAIEPVEDHGHPRDAAERTWFYDKDGKFAGWINAGHITETSNFDGMLFRDANDRVIAVTKNYLVTRVEQFTWPDGSMARPFKLFADLHLGFFVRGKNLTLAKWSDWS